MSFGGGGIYQARWGSTLRSLALGGVLGTALVLFVLELAAGHGFAALLSDNQMDLATRTAMLGRMAMGAAAGTVIVALILLLQRRYEHEGVVERVLWTLSPAVVLPAVPIVTTALAWQDRHANLLVVVLAATMLVEVLVLRSLASAPPSLVAAWSGARHHMPRLWKRHGPFLVVLAAALFYAVFMSHYTLRAHYKLATANFDLSIENNLAFGALHGRFLESPVTIPENPAAYGVVHVKLGQYVFLPIYALYPRPETLLVLQSTLLGLGALPLYAFARRYTGRWLAVAVALAYLAYYPMHSANFFEVHAPTFAGFFVLATIWALDARRWIWLVLAATAAALMREDIPLMLAVIGVFSALAGHRPRSGIALAVVAALWFSYLRFYWMEAKGNQFDIQWWFAGMYKGLYAPGEDGFKSVIKTLISNPAFVIHRLVEKDRLYYLLHLLVPIAFLPARRWYLWAAFIPGFVVTLLATDYKPPTMFSFQYVMFWVPLLFAAAPLALWDIASRPDRGPLRATAAASAMLFASFALQYNYGAFPARDNSLRSGYKYLEFTFSPEERQRYADLRDVIALIPSTATVAATENVGPHVSSRVVLYSARYGPHGAEYYLARRNELDLKETRPKLRDALTSRAYGVLYRKGEFALMKRGHDTSGNDELLRDWGLSPAP